jgi:polyisoprenoid-binding protein YceI
MAKRSLIPAGFAVLSSILVAAAPAPVDWNVDEPHTGINFSVKHFFTPVHGRFDAYEIDLRYDRENPENSSVQVRIEVARVNTGSEKRDNHLRSGDFLEVEAYPYITFASEEVLGAGPNRLLVRGPLTIKGETRTVELPVSIVGVKDIPGEMQGMFGGVTQVASFETGLTLDRRDYGVGVGNWAATLVVGGGVDIEVAVEANRK